MLNQVLSAYFSHCPGTRLAKLREDTKASTRIIDNPAELRTRCILNTSVERYMPTDCV